MIITDTSTFVTALECYTIFMKPDIHRLIELQQLFLVFTQIERGVHRKQNDVFIPENDSEHSYTLAMTAWYLSKWFPELNQSKLIRFALAHDLVEIHAGDTFFYGTPEELGSKQEREAIAYKQLENDWSDFDDMLSSIKSYETRDSNEARFVYALDKVLPIIQVFINEGYSWKKHKITMDVLHEYKVDKISLSPEVKEYFDQLIVVLQKHPEIISR